MVGEASSLTGLGVHEPELADGVVHEADPVEVVAEPIDEVVIRLGRLTGLSRTRRAAPAPILVARRTARAARDEQRPAVRRPLEPVDAARQIREPASLAAVPRQEVDLLRGLAILPVARGS